MKKLIISFSWNQFMGGKNIPESMIFDFEKVEDITDKEISKRIYERVGTYDHYVEQIQIINNEKTN